jgi:hypothetical protein
MAVAMLEDLQHQVSQAGELLYMLVTIHMIGDVTPVVFKRITLLLDRFTPLLAQ